MDSSTQGSVSAAAVAAVDLSSTANPVVVRINPSRAIPHATIRQVRSAWVEGLMDSIRTESWIETRPLVYGPIPLQEMRAIAAEPENIARPKLDDMTFRIIDGAHRMEAMQRLQRSSGDTQFGADFLVEVLVLPEHTSIAQRTAVAVKANKVNAQLSAKKTYCDELWTYMSIHSSVFSRVVAFSARLAVPIPQDNPNASKKRKPAKTGRNRRFKANFDVSFDDVLKSLDAAHRETPQFEKTYGANIDPHMCYELHANLRRVFDPDRQEDWDVCNTPVLLDLVSDSYNPDESAQPVQPTVKRNEGVNVKYRFIRELIPFHVELKVGSSAAESTVGGNGYVRDITRRTPAWDYMCAVNDRLKPGARDELSHSRLYRTCFRKNFGRPLCGLLMLMEASFRSDGGRSIGGVDSGRANGIQRHTDMGVVYSQVCAVFRQYDTACSTLSDVKTIEVLVLPFLIFCSKTLLFKALERPEDGWGVDHFDFLALPETKRKTDLHPKVGKPYKELTPAEKTNDDECRVLARTFIRDIRRSATMSLADHRRLFGTFDAAKDRVCEEPMPTHMVTEHIKSIFGGLRVAGFKADEFRSDCGNDGSDGGGAGAAQNEDVAEEDDTVGLDADVVRIQRFACRSLANRDRAHMFLASFEEFAALPDIQTLFGTVSLVLTDPPYNTRREAGARNSEHDRFSLSDMQKAADIIERLLRPYGHAFIFCSYQQSADWRNALVGAGGGSFMNVSRVPEVIVRDNQAVSSGGIFRLHRINAVEYAWHAYKDKRPVDAGADDAADATAANDAYRATVGFGNGDIDLCSGSSMSPYVNVIDRYTPPRGSELIRSNGKIVRPEQKSVPLLRDIIRLFAPNPTDIVVDLCAGTMSTVIAALQEGRPVYACELFKDCFEVGQRRVHNFQYRRAAAGLVPGLSPEDVTRVQRFIPARSAAPDTLTHEPETYTVHSPPPE
jgi:hypothetical protein